MTADDDDMRTTKLMRRTSNVKVFKVSRQEDIFDLQLTQ